MCICVLVVVTFFLAAAMPLGTWGRVDMFREAPRHWEIRSWRFGPVIAIGNDYDEKRLVGHTETSI